MVDLYAVAVKKDLGERVGHMLKISRMCNLFLQQGYVLLTATITGRHGYSSRLGTGWAGNFM